MSKSFQSLPPALLAVLATTLLVWTIGTPPKAYADTPTPQPTDTSTPVPSTPTPTSTPAVTSTPTPTSTPTTPTFSLTASPNILGCGGTSTITATPSLATPAQVLVFSSIFGGSFNPTSVAFDGANSVQTTFIVSTAVVNQSATIALLTSAGIVLGQTQVTINCAGVTPTPTAPASLSLQAVPNNLACGASAAISVTGAIDGATVNLTSSIGTLSPLTATATSGGILSVLTAPPDRGGSATVTATSGAATGSIVVTINCSPTPTTVPATSVAPIATTTPAGSIRPPNTGDGGLAASASAP